LDDEIRKEIRKFALQNAFEHEGKTQDKIVLSKILGTKPEFRTKVKEIIK
jgi:glutamyl-tRNA synthetase